MVSDEDEYLARRFATHPGKTNCGQPHLRVFPYATRFKTGTSGVAL